MLTPEKIAIIDVGSNSCRMVIYEQVGAALLPYFNEKAMAGLGRGLPETGRLSQDGKVLALDTFRRFRAILEGLGIEKVYAVATAAVRVAEDGKAFRKKAETALGVPLRILDGPEEGRISALGVVAGFRKAKGLVADLGGSSLELQPVGSEIVGAGETYLLGPLARAKDQKLSADKRQKVITKILGPSKLLPIKAGRLFAVGGAWRNVAAVHMALSDYPLGVIHAYTLDRKALATVVGAMDRAQTDRDMRALLQGVAKRRYDTLLHATLVLDRLLELANLETAHISAYGLREGLAADANPGEPQNGLIDTTELYFKFSADSTAFGRSLYAFLRPILETIAQHANVLEFTCFMADAGARLHPDHRASLVFEQVLRAPMPALNHTERLFAAFAVASRYTFKFAPPQSIEHILSTDVRVAARLLGTAMRLGSIYSGRSARILKTARLERTGKRLVLKVLSANRDMISDTVKRRFNQLSGLLELQPVIEAVDKF